MENFMIQDADQQKETLTKNQKKLEQATKLKQQLESYMDILNQLIEKNTKRNDNS